MVDISSLRRDSKVVAEGQWVEQIPNFGNARLRVRGLTSPKATELRARLNRQAPKSDRHRDGSLKHEANARVLAEVLHSAILLEWDGLTDGGQPVAYDADKAWEWLSNPDYRAFSDAVTWAAAIVDEGNAEATEELAGNSRRPSAGSSKTAK